MMTRDLSDEDHRASTPGPTSGSEGRNAVGPGLCPSDRGSMVGSPEDEEPGPDVVKVKIESELVDDSFPQCEDLIVKLKVKSEFVDESSSQNKDVDGNLKVDPEFEDCTLGEIKLEKFSCAKCSELVNREVSFNRPTGTFCQDVGKFRNVPQNINNDDYCDKCLKILQQEIQRSEKPHWFSVCNKAITSSSFKRGEKLHTGLMPHRCTVCNKGFASSSYLSLHQSLHTGEKPFKCSKCKKAYMCSSLLTRHQRTHTHETPHRCTVCNKGFASSSYLSVHQRIHTGEKPYTCSVCNKAFNQSSNLSVHKRIHIVHKRIRTKTLLPYPCYPPPAFSPTPHPLLPVFIFSLGPAVGVPPSKPMR